MVLCLCRAAEFLAQCTVWTELVVSLEWLCIEAAGCRFNHSILSWRLGISSPCVEAFIEETFVDPAGLCYRTWCA